MKGLGIRALGVALQELAAGVKEEPLGSNTGPRIREYFAGCYRNGKLVGITAGEWCAAFASWCASMAEIPEIPKSEPERRYDYIVTPPHFWRAAVWELVDDARRAGKWHSAESGDGYVPRLGDLAVLRRGSSVPTVRGGLGHVGRLAQPTNAEGKYVLVEGNHQHRVALVERSIFAPDRCGWIEYPSPELTDEEREQALASVAVVLDRIARELPIGGSS